MTTNVITTVAVIMTLAPSKKPVDGSHPHQRARAYEQGRALVDPGCTIAHIPENRMKSSRLVRVGGMVGEIRRPIWNGELGVGTASVCGSGRARFWLGAV